MEKYEIYREVANGLAEAYWNLNESIKDGVQITLPDVMDEVQREVVYALSRLVPELNADEPPPFEPPNF